MKIDLQGKLLLIHVFLDLIANLALLVALSNLSGFVGRQEKRGRTKVIQGLLFGAMAIFGMLRPLVFAPGIIFDGRSVVLSLCAFFFGPLASLIASGMAVVTRVIQGGAGATMGVLVILASTGWGLWFRLKAKDRENTWRDFLFLGLAVHVSMLLLMFTLPGASALAAIRKIGLPVLLLYPLVTLLIAKVLAGHLNAAAIMETLRESEERYRSVIMASPDNITILDLSGKVIMVSPVGKTMFGYDQDEELAGRNAFEFITPEDRERVRGLFSRILKEGSIFTGECLGLRKDGSVFPVETNTQVIRDAQGQVVRVVLVTRDISERKILERERLQLESRLVQAQKMEGLGRLAGGVAHDMNNVLSAILGLASAHVDEDHPERSENKAFGTIVKAAERGGKMVRSLLNFARQSLAEEKLLDLNGLIREEVSLLERTTLARVDLKLNLAKDLFPIKGDAGAFSHALMNLCVNAVDALEEVANPGGTLMLTTRNLPEDWVEIRVEDSGPGMRPEVLEKALDPFFTTKGPGKGTGLGLSMVYSAVKAHQGQMEIQSSPGMGTCVILRFPAARETIAAGSSDTHPVQNPNPSLKILLVDDDELIRASMQSLLGVMGHQARVVSSGEEALDVLKVGEAFDWVILDLNMPGLGGAGTLPLLRQRFPDLPVLLSTGRADQVALDLAAKDSHTKILAKPFGMTELRKFLH